MPYLYPGAQERAGRRSKQEKEKPLGKIQMPGKTTGKAYSQDYQTDVNKGRGKSHHRGAGAGLGPGMLLG